MKGLAVFRERTAVGLLAYLATARIARAAFPVVFVVCLAHNLGYAAAAAAQAVMVIAAASSAPLRARMLDSWGSRRTLPVQIAVSWVSLTALSVLIGHAPNLAPIITLGILGTVSSPAIDPAVRTSWRSVADGQEQLGLLHTADSLLEEAGFLIGPALAAGLMLSIGYRWSPVVIAVAAGLNNVAAMSYSSVRRALFVDPPKRADGQQVPAEQQAGRASRLARVIAGPIVQQDLRRIITPVALMGGSFGVLAITLPSLASHHGSIASSGFLTALISVGGVAGGIAYGALSKKGTPQVRQSVLGIMFGVPVILLLVARSPWLIGLILLASGLAVTPLYINSYILIDGLIASDVKHEANSWVPVGNDVGYVAGISIGGALLTKASLGAALAAAAAFGILLVGASLRTLNWRRQPDEGAVPAAARNTVA